MELKADLWFPSIIFAGINEDINLDFLKVTASNLKGDDNSMNGVVTLCLILTT